MKRWKPVLRFDLLQARYKYCPKCGISKPTVEFTYTTTGVKKVFRYSCKACEAEAVKSRAAKYKHSNKGKEAIKKYSRTEIRKLSGRVQTARRKARKKMVHESFTREQADYVFNQFDKKCFKCGSKKALCIDHHYPLSKGNPLTIDNAVLLCNRCNVAKHNREPDSFYTYNELYVLTNMYNKRKCIINNTVGTSRGTEKCG